MVKIDNDVALALANNVTKNFGNTAVRDRAVFLHGNKMARLNAILYAFGTGVTVNIKGGEAYYTFEGCTKPFNETLTLYRK